MHVSEQKPWRRALDAWERQGRGLVVVLTGAGISAESGIPTFRGTDGYWTIGSRNHRPMELATHAAFRAMPEVVWAFYLTRIARHAGAEPNAAHRALVALEERLGDRFLLVTQNVDGLHARAGNSEARTYRIHGDLGGVRCDRGCAPHVRPFPAGFVDAVMPDGTLAPGIAAQLRCVSCAGWLRPHVLWFDECYDEYSFRFDSTLRAAEEAELLLVVGTSGATNLPFRVVERVAARRRPLVVVGPEDSPFSALAERSPVGAFVRGTAGAIVPELVHALCGDEVVR